MKRKKNIFSSRHPKPKADRRLRKMKMATERGMSPVTIHGSKQATTLALYMNAVGAFLRTGNTDALEQFEGRSVAGNPLITDPKVLTSLAHAGALQLETLYVTPESSS